jgi:hypothetical protein
MTKSMKLTAAVALWFAAAGTAAQAQPTIEFTGGRWFDGRAFESRTMYSVAGVLRTARPPAIDSSIDLAGGYVVPPFGEAHNHNVEASSRTDMTLARYVLEGIFYVLNPNNLPRSVVGLGERVNKPNVVDAIFAHGGLNVTGGHPWDLVQRNIGRGTWRAEDAEGAFYHTIDDRAALDSKWPAILAGRPNLIKLYLLFSNEYERRRLDTTVRGMKGLNPSLVPEIVRRAHAAGIRVAAHIENTSDFQVAVGAGVDLIAHMPGYGWNGVGDSTQFTLSAADAAGAARRGTAVITTLAFGQRATAPNRTPAQRSRDALNAANLRVLKHASVKIGIGSDNYGATSRSEAMYLSDLGVFTNLELLKMWSETTPQLIFPGRQFAALRDGFEASFVVLDSDPLQDFGAVQRLTRRIKQGHLLP